MTIIPNTNIICMATALFASIAIFLALLFGVKKKTGSKVSVFFIGCLCFALFALVLEQSFHSLIFGLTGDFFTKDIWLYALYGGLAAGVFEECGRWAGFSFFLKRGGERVEDSLMYGAGHGGFEALYLLGGGMVSNLAVSLMLNSGMDASGLGLTPEIVQTLAQTAPANFLVGILERCLAIVLHISLSIVVWSAVKRGKRYRLPLAVLIHAAVDAGAIVCAHYISNILIIELIVAVASALCAVYAAWIYRREKATAA